MSEVVLRGRNITRRWGGVLAVNGVSIDLVRGEVHAVIGTNGAGKSTLINVLSGEIPASSGSVELLGADVTRWTQPRRARAGLGRSYQRNTVFEPFTVRENCRLAAQARHQRPWRVWFDASRCDVSVAAGLPAGRRPGHVGGRSSPRQVLPRGGQRPPLNSDALGPATHEHL